MAEGPFQPDWSSLAAYRCPEWFRDAKFGIWAHWSCQCEPEQGDWYARNMYIEGGPDYKFHVAHYGHPSKFGFKDVIHQWKAATFDPDKLLGFYKENGAKYFMALAVHCDNLDNYNSKYQPWNSVNVGPHKDLIAGWAAGARKHGLRFGVSVHNGGWTWRWFETAQGADTKGPLAGVPYDGKLTKADGRGQWWEGLDPQDLYAQNHAKGAKPDRAYCEKFYLRVKQLWDDYQPDLIYFDDTMLPLHLLGGDDAYGLSLYAHFYNSSIRRRGRNEAVVNAKGLQPIQRKAIVYDIERGKAGDILPEPWQTDTCLGDWHYRRSIFEKHQYKSAASVIKMLVDIVSKNGNLMLSVPLQRGGQPDPDEIKIVAGIGAWLKINGEAIYATRPWKVYGEGPSTVAQEKAPYDRAGVKDVGSKPYTAEDIRFTQSKDGTALYAVALDAPSAPLRIHSLAGRKIAQVTLLGSGAALDWKQEADALVIQPAPTWPSNCAVAFKIRWKQ